ncbi:MAG: CHAT domain-containing tetratricopeptide repeat protein [Acidobacteriota bacterium]
MIRLLSFLVFSIVAAGIAAADPLDEARAYYAAGKLAAAAEAFRRAAIELEPTDPATAGAARNNACVLWLNTGEPLKAEEDCRHALRLRSGGEPNEPLAKTHNNLGLVLKRIADYRAALREFEVALAINGALDNPAGQAINLSNLGATAIEAGWYAQAIERFEAMGALAAQHAGEAWVARQTHLSRINLAVVYERLGAYREALRLYDEALSAGASLSRSEQATLAINRGVAYRNLGDPVQAESAFRQAAATYRELDDRPALINVDLNLALVNHLNLRRPEDAERFYREALDLARRTGETTQETQCLDYLGRFLLDTGRLDEAETSFTQALALAEKSASSEATAVSLEGLGRCAQARGRFEAALEYATRGIVEIENIRGGLGADTLRASYRASKRPVFTLAVEVLAALDDSNPSQERATQALEVVHRAKARELAEALSLDALPLPSSIPKPARGGLLVEYFVGERDLFRWTVSDRGIAMQNLGPAAVVLESVATVHRQLSSGQRPDAAILEQLATTLLDRLEPSLDRVRTLTISPDLGLSNLPFELLSSGPGEPLLVERFTMNYLPSGALPTLAPARSGSRTRVSLGIGDPDTGVAQADFVTRRFGLAPLAAAAAELELLQRWIGKPVEIRTGAAATEENFTQRYVEGARVIHVATHTVLDEEAVESSAILLSPGADSDGLLHSREIAKLHGASDLTVLAACRTAAGRGSAESARTTLTGAFLLSGSSAVLATLWDIDDATTHAFMEQFYYELGGGRRPSEALSRAKRTFLADPDWNNPSLWAAYVLIGDSPPVGRRGGAWVVWIAILAVAIPAGWYFYGRISKRVG